MGDRFFGNAIREGQPISRDGFAAGLRGMSRALDKMSIYGGKVSWSSDNVPKLIPAGPDPGVPLSGDMYVNGKHLTYELPTDKRYLKLDYTGGSFELTFENELIMVDDYFPVGVHYWDLSREQGDIHWNVP